MHISRIRIKITLGFVVQQNLRFSQCPVPLAFLNVHWHARCAPTFKDSIARTDILRQNLVLCSQFKVTSEKQLINKQFNGLQQITLFWVAKIGNFHKIISRKGKQNKQLCKNIAIFLLAQSILILYRINEIDYKLKN